eukprot:gene21576-25913_t
MDVDIPRDLDPEIRADTVATEKAYSQDLQRQGKWVHLWRIVGQFSNISIFDVESADELHEILWNLPLFPYMTIEPAMSAVSATPPSLPESVQQWHCEMSETFGGLCPESSVDAAPVGTVSGVSLGDVGAFDISGSPQILRRSARAAKRHGSDLLKICTVRTGSAILRQSDRELTAPPGAMILYDVEHSYALRFDGHWSCTVMTLPRSAVSLTERELNCALERTHDGRRGSGALLENFISGAVASQVDGSAAGLLGDAGVNLASAVLMQGSAPATPGRSTREEILRYALRNLDSPDLSVASIAGALHLSPRTVQRHFGDGDLTLSALIRRERLIRVRRDLTDVSLRGHSISILAARWCFHDAPAFSRAFKAEFGAAPSEVRNSPDPNAREPRIPGQSVFQIAFSSSRRAQVHEQRGPQRKLRIEELMTNLLAHQQWHGKIFDGQWIDGGGDTVESLEPATGEVLGVIGTATAADIDRAAHIASAAQPAWAATIGQARASVIRKAAQILEAERAEVERWLIREGGSVPGKAAFEVDLVISELWEASALPTQPFGHLLPASQEGRTSIGRRVPLGVVGVISPWNFPLLLAMRAVAPALALGNGVVLKPDVQTAI